MDVQADAASKAGTSPHDKGRGAFAFAGLVLDLDACTLKRESGEAIALTRGEFALLREFVRRPGRVLSRDFLLDAAVGRRNAPFDRSVDVMVGRLRKKVEPDPKQPSVIQTVPGEGYRFTAPLSPRKPVAETAAPSPGGHWHRAAGCEPANVANAMAGPGGRSRALPHRCGCHDLMAPRPSGSRAAALDRRPAVRKYEWRQGSGLFRRRDHRRPDD